MILHVVSLAPPNTDLVYLSDEKDIIWAMAHVDMFLREKELYKELNDTGELWLDVKEVEVDDGR